MTDPKLPRFPSLRIVLVVPFLIQIFAAVSLVGYLSFRNGEKAVNQLASRWQREILNRTRETITNYLAISEAVLETNVDAIFLEQLDTQNPEVLATYFLKQILRFPDALRSIYFAGDYKNGEYAFARRNLDGTLNIRKYQNFPLRTTYLVNENGEIIQELATQPFDIGSRPSHQTAISTGKPTWGKIYEFTEGDLGMALSAPVFYRNGELHGVISLNLTLALFTQFLQQREVSENGEIFILDRQGYVISSSTDESPYQKGKISGELELVKASESSISTIYHTAQALQNQLGDFHTIGNNQQLKFTADGQRHFASVTPFQNPYGIDWLIIVVVPEQDFMTQINANTRTTVILSLGALVLASFLSLYTSHWITKPILALSKSSQAMSQGNLEQQVQGGTIKELLILANAFNHMATELKTSFTHLEQKVQERTTELSATLNQLKQTQAQLIHSEKMSSLGQLVAGIAHEINNPISFIHGNLKYTGDYINELLDLLDAYQCHFPDIPSEIAQLSDNIDVDFLRIDLPKSLLSMQKGTERIRNIILSLRTFSRLDESDLKLIDIHEGLESTLEILGSRLCGVMVVRDYGQLEPIQCYAGQLNQVFLNLMMNSLDGFDRQGDIGESPCITLRTKQLDSDWIRMEVSDNGPGISEGDRPKIFDAFFTTKAVGKGTGLGLYMSYQIIVQQHRGRLWCLPESDRGVTFVIEIPIR